MGTKGDRTKDCSVWMLEWVLGVFVPVFESVFVHFFEMKNGMLMRTLRRWSDGVGGKMWLWRKFGDAPSRRNVVMSESGC